MPLDIYGGYILPKTDFCISFCFLALENSRHFGTPPLVSSRNDVWETSAELPLMTCYYPELISASDWSCGVGHLFQPIGSSTQIWVVTRHQYGIFALVSQISFRGETSDHQWWRREISAVFSGYKICYFIFFYGAEKWSSSHVES